MHRKTKCGVCEADLTKEGSVLLRYTRTQLTKAGRLVLPGQETGPDEEQLSCAECGQVIDHHIKTVRGPKHWVNTWGLDAETLVNVAHYLDRDFWHEGPASRDRSMSEYFNFIYEVCSAFQAFHAGTDWDDDEWDYWIQIDQFMTPVMDAAKAPDSGFLSWDVERILQIVKEHIEQKGQPI